MDYLAWNDAIAGTFFTPELKGRRVFLYLTEALLGEIGEKKGTQRDDFLSAVKEGPPFAPGGNVCEKALMCLVNWRSSGVEWPPYLGYLALFVLAAGLEGEFAPNAYYPRLRKLLGEPPVTSTNPTYPRFTEMRRLWEDLELWSARDKHGDLGLFQVYVPGRLVHVGLPISQVILSEHERRALPALFAEAGLAAVSNPSDLLMRQCLLRYGAELRSRTLLALEDSTVEAEFIIFAALQALEEWDGSVFEEQDSALQKRGAVRLCLTEIDDVGGRIRVRIRCRLQKDFPEGSLELSDGRETYRCEKEVRDWSTPIVRAESDEEFDASRLNWSEPFHLSVRGAQLRFQMLASDARIFASAEAEELNGYVEVQFLPREQKLFVLTTERAAPVIEQWGRRFCVGFRSMTVLRGLPTGWRMFVIESVQDDKWIRCKYPQFAFSSTTQILVRGGIRDLGGAYFPFALPTIDVVGAPDSARLFVNGLSVGMAGRKDFQLDISHGGNLEFRIEVQDRGTTLRHRTLYIRAPEQFLVQTTYWVDRLGQEVNESVESRASGGHLIGQISVSFDDWVAEPTPTDVGVKEPQGPEIPKSAVGAQNISLQTARALLSDWKQEIAATVGTKFTSELAQFPGGRKLSEGAWQYKRAVESNRPRQFGRAMTELRSAVESDHPVVRIAAFVLLYLILRRTSRSLPSPPMVPEYAHDLVNQLAQSAPESQKQPSELQLSIHDISPVNEDESMVLSNQNTTSIGGTDG